MTIESSMVFVNFVDNPAIGVLLRILPFEVNFEITVSLYIHAMNWKYSENTPS
jgi:hypothetical protein